MINDDNYDENYNNYGIIFCDMINMRKEVIDYTKQCQKNNIFKQDNILDSSKEINILKMVFIKLYKYIFDIMCVKETFTLEDELQ